MERGRDYVAVGERLRGALEWRAQAASEDKGMCHPVRSLSGLRDSEEEEQASFNVDISDTPTGLCVRNLLGQIMCGHFLKFRQYKRYPIFANNKNSLRQKFIIFICDGVIN